MARFTQDRMYEMLSEISRKPKRKYNAGGKITEADCPFGYSLVNGKCVPDPDCEDGQCRETDEIQAIYDYASTIPQQVVNFERSMVDHIQDDLGGNAKLGWKEEGIKSFVEPSCMYIAGLGYRCAPATETYFKKFNPVHFNSNQGFIHAVDRGDVPFTRVGKFSDRNFDAQEKGNVQIGDIVNFKGADNSHAMTFVGYTEDGHPKYIDSNGDPADYGIGSVWRNLRPNTVGKGADYAYVNRFNKDRFIKDTYSKEIEALEKQARENPTYYKAGGQLSKYNTGGVTEPMMAANGEAICPDGYEYNAQSGWCEMKSSRCPDGYVPDGQGGCIEDRCQPGYEKDANGNCVPDTSGTKYVTDPNDPNYKDYLVRQQLHHISQIPNARVREAVYRDFRNNFNTYKNYYNPETGYTFPELVKNETGIEYLDRYYGFDKNGMSEDAYLYDSFSGPTNEKGIYDSQSAYYQGLRENELSNLEKYVKAKGYDTQNYFLDGDYKSDFAKDPYVSKYKPSKYDVLVEAAGDMVTDTYGYNWDKKQYIKPNTSIIEDQIDREKLKKIYPTVTDEQINKEYVIATENYVTNAAKNQGYTNYLTDHQGSRNPNEPDLGLSYNENAYTVPNDEYKNLVQQSKDLPDVVRGPSVGGIHTGYKPEAVVTRVGTNATVLPFYDAPSEKYKLATELKKAEMLNELKREVPTYEKPKLELEGFGVPAYDFTEGKYYPKKKNTYKLFLNQRNDTQPLIRKSSKFVTKKEDPLIRFITGYDRERGTPELYDSRKNWNERYIAATAKIHEDLENAENVKFPSFRGVPIASWDDYRARRKYKKEWKDYVRNEIPAILERNKQAKEAYDAEMEKIRAQEEADALKRQNKKYGGLIRYPDGGQNDPPKKRPVIYVDDENDPRYKDYLIRQALYNYSNNPNFEQRSVASDYLKMAMNDMDNLEKWKEFGNDYYKKLTEQIEKEYLDNPPEQFDEWTKNFYESFKDPNLGYYGSKIEYSSLPNSALKSDKDFGSYFDFSNEIDKPFFQKYAPVRWDKQMRYTDTPYSNTFATTGASRGSRNYWTTPNTVFIEDDIDRNALRKIYPNLTDADINRYIEDRRKHPDYISNNFTNNGYEYADTYAYPNGELAYLADPKKKTFIDADRLKGYLQESIVHDTPRYANYLPIWAEPEEVYEIKRPIIDMEIKRPELIKQDLGLPVLPEEPEILPPTYTPLEARFYNTKSPDWRIKYMYNPLTGRGPNNTQESGGIPYPTIDNWYTNSHMFPGDKRVQNRTDYDEDYYFGTYDDDDNYIKGELEKAEEEKRRINFSGGARGRKDKKAQKEYNKSYDEYEKLMEQKELEKKFAESQLNMYKYLGNKKEGGLMKFIRTR